MSSLLRTACVLSLHLAMSLAFVHGQQPGETNPARSTGWQSFSAQGRQPDSAANNALENLVRKYTSTADIRGSGQSAGKVRVIWLHKELLTEVVRHYAEAQHKSPEEMNLLRAQLERKLEIDKSFPFLIVIEPERNAMIGRPEWTSDPDHKRYFPSIQLRGTASKMGYPYKWQQILGEGNGGYFTAPIWAYVLYKDRADDGTTVVHSDDFSFSVEYRAPAVIGATEYAVEAEFHFDLMPIPVQEIVAGVTSRNNSMVRTFPKPAYVARQDGVPAVAHVTYSQASATDLSRQEIFQIIGLALSFAEFVIKVASL